MIKIIGLRIYENLPFEDYLKLPGKSFTSLKFMQQFDPTPKMQLGTAVHNYLTADGSYNGANMHLVRPLAHEVKKWLGTDIKGNYEVSFTCTLIYGGYALRYKGRIDFLADSLIIDFKISEQNPLKAIEYFKYKYQIAGYCLPFKIERAILLFVHPGKRVVTPIFVAPEDCNHWWQKKILDYGDEIK